MALPSWYTILFLHDTQSLFYWVFKANFFPNCSVMDATNPSNASYAWKSILKAREVINHGASWRVGTGTSVDNWGDNLLPTKNNPRIISPCMPGLPSNKVSNLIDPVQRVWKEQVLDRYFFEFEAAVIKRIPFCRNSLPTKTNRVKRKVIVEVYVITVSNHKRILPMLCTIAQTWTVFGPRYHSGTTVPLNKAWVSLRCLVLFLPRIETLNYLSRWYGRFGIVVTISDWASPWYLWVSYCS